MGGNFVKGDLITMIKNCLCATCKHLFVCKKYDIIQKFDNENKKFIGIDITMDLCEDYENK
jgi:hypothetical protein